MKRLLSIFALIGSVATAHVAVAGERAATFTIENMTCASCPYIVRTSMAAVQGVTQVNVSFQAKTATVTFDDAKTNADAIAAASARAGLPARLKDLQQERIRQ
jgi:periplasmic mercuric ion binding protein